MKRDLNAPDTSSATSSSNHWQFDDATDVLASYDTVMWDELHDLSRSEPQFQSSVAPNDLISGFNPFQPSIYAMQTNSGANTGNDLLTPITGGGTGLDFRPSVTQTRNARGIENYYEQKAAPLGYLKSPVTSSDTFSDFSQSAADKRRQKNREWMRNARQKKRDEVNSMKITVARLERQYEALSLQSAEGGALLSQNQGTSEYTQAVDLSKRLGAENLYLKAQIQQKMLWELNLLRVLQSCPEIDGPRWAQQFQQPALGGEAVLRMQLDKLSEFEAAEEFGFHALDDLGLTHAIMENNRTISRVQNQLLVPSSSDSDNGARTRRVQTFGWNMVQRVQGNIMECVFTKRFYGLNVAQLMQKTWANDMRLGEYKKVKGEVSKHSFPHS